MLKEGENESKKEPLARIDELKGEVEVANRERGEAGEELKQLKEKIIEFGLAKLLPFIIATLAIVAVIGLFIMPLNSFEKKFEPASDALADAFISSASAYDDGQHVLDLEGYMKKNGFSVKYKSAGDKEKGLCQNIWFGDGKVSILLQSAIYYPLELGTLSSRIVIYRGKGLYSEVSYTTEYVSNINDETISEIVMDANSSFIFHRVALEILDKVLKGENLKEGHGCPFEGLGVDHQVSVNNRSAAHKD
ncbi:hypothetical protein IJH33_01550 [Candidatus Saccharibacteria bacterium]|nr:hypothetical protein [Candidatus Saccharibacteria bacterium]